MENKSRRILLFEDDFQSMRDTREYLEVLGYETELSAAASILERLPREQFDLIIVDSMIQPKSFDGTDHEVENVHYEGVHWADTGTEFLKRLRNGDYSSGAPEGTPPDVPVIMLSAVAEQTVPDAVRNVTLLEKPFKLTQLIDKIRQIVQE